MKKALSILLFLSIVILFVYLGFYFSGRSSQGFVAESSSCSLTMTEVIASAQGNVYDMSGVTDYSEPESYYLTAYSVSGESITDPVYESVPDDLKDEQADLALQIQVWQMFTDLIPPEDREMVVQFNVFTDGFENTLAAVDQRLDDPSQWMLEVDLADLENRDALMFTMIHEYAHLLTLNASQVKPDPEIVANPTEQALLERKAAACPNYFAGTGCSYEDSYIHAFYNRFWLEIDDEWQKIDALQYEAQDLTEYYDALYEFYKTHRDQFVDDYATTHPAEDIAESFAYFVFSPRPIGNSIKEQKIAFFYEYPELVRLRENILSGACSMEK